MKNFAFWKRTVVGALTAAACLSAGLTASAAETRAVVSYGVNVLAAQLDMAVSGRVGNEIVLDAETFARNLNLSRIDYITVESLPRDTEGELLLGSSRVAAGQSISGANLSYLTFAAAGDDIRHASFTFTANGSQSPTVCNLYLLDRGNSTPTLSYAPDLSLNVSTYRSLPVYGMLSAYDADGDEMTFEIVSYPQNGAIQMTDRSEGTYVYLPNDGYVGTDSFSYVARDRYGNYSAAATVNLRVSVSGTSVTYADMQDSEALGAALTLGAAGIMSGVQVGDRHYFYPERTVTRAEFLVMAMHAAGMQDLPDCTETIFFDDAAIPTAMKPYAAAAYSLGYISGTNVAGNLCFLPNDEITCAEAAVMLDAILNLDAGAPAVTPTFADGSTIPAWARESVYQLHAEGILRPTDGCISANAKLTREETAKILSAVLEYRK